MLRLRKGQLAGRFERHVICHFAIVLAGDFQARDLERTLHRSEVRDNNLMADNAAVENACRISASLVASLNRPRPDTDARLMPAPSSSSRQRLALSACVISTVSALNARRRVRKPATVVYPPPPAIFTSRSLPFWAVIIIPLR